MRAELASAFLVPPFVMGPGPRTDEERDEHAAAMAAMLEARHADVAQLVERHLAMVEVAGS